MNHKEQEVAFSNELDALCERFIKEFDLTACQAIGILTDKIHLILHSHDEDE